MDDEPILHFDHHIRDPQNGVRVDVTLCSPHDDDVQINVMPINGSSPRLSFFLTLDAAIGLGHALVAAGQGNEDVMARLAQKEKS